MPLKLRRTLSMEDLQNASDDEMDELLAASEDMEARTSCPSGCQQNGGSSQRERFFSFSLTSDASASSSCPPTQSHRPRPRAEPRPPSRPIIVPVVMPDSDDFFLHGPQAPILKLNHVDSERINGISRPSREFSSSCNGTHHPHHHQHFHSNNNGSISKGVRFEEDPCDYEDEYNRGCREGDRDRDQLSSVQSQVNQVTQKMKDNIGRLLEREASLDSLADLSDQFHYSGDIYRQSTEHLRRKLWWRQQKTRFVLTALIIFFMLLLLVPLISRLFRGNWG